MKCELPDVMCANVRSCLRQLDDLTVSAKLMGADIVTVTESWCHDGIPDGKIDIPGYCVCRNDRTHKRGGGVLAYIRTEYAHREWTELYDDRFESIRVTLKASIMPRMCSHVIPGVIYHPPSDPEQPMMSHVLNYVDARQQAHPYAGIMLKRHIHLAQICRRKQ
jgi:hypothetical protein